MLLFYVGNPFVGGIMSESDCSGLIGSPIHLLLAQKDGRVRGWIERSRRENRIICFRDANQVRCLVTFGSNRSGVRQY